MKANYLQSRSWFKPASKNGGVNELCLQNETFGFLVIAAWPVTNDQMFKALKFYKAPHKEVRPLNENSSKCVLHPEKSRYYIFFTEQSCRRVSDIAHESFHAVCDAMIQRGIEPHKESGEEAWAYTLGWLTNEVLSKVIASSVFRRKRKG